MDERDCQQQGENTAHHHRRQNLTQPPAQVAPHGHHLRIRANPSNGSTTPDPARARLASGRCLKARHQPSCDGTGMSLGLAGVHASGLGYFAMGTVAVARSDSQITPST
jgi:hypothetical protein